MKKKNNKRNYIPKKHNGILKASLNLINDRVRKDLPYMYSAVALAMWNLVDGDEEEKHDAILDLIQMSYAIWNDIVQNDKNVIEECERITGIDVRMQVK